MLRIEKRQVCHDWRLDAGRVDTSNGRVILLLRRGPGTLEGYGLRTEGDIAALKLDSEGHLGPAFVAGNHGLSYEGQSYAGE